MTGHNYTNRINNILFVTQGGKHTASTRFRVLMFLDNFHRDGIKTKILELPSNKKTISRIFFILKILLNCRSFQLVYIQKVLLPTLILNIIHIFNRNIVYDWDDAIFTHPPSELFSEKKLQRNKIKLKSILKKSALVISGNDYLKEYSERYSNNVSVIPTAVKANDANVKKPRINKKTIIGWIGRSENLTYLTDLTKVFKQLESKHGDKVCLQVVCDKPLIIDNLSIIQNVKWTLENEASDIQSFDIGIMPLTDDEWTRGKCAFKLLQYMSAGVACIGSPVGANKEVINHNVNGLLAENETDWFNSINKLILDEKLRMKLSENGMKTIEKNYSSDVVYLKIIKALNVLINK